MQSNAFASVRVGNRKARLVAVGLSILLIVAALGNLAISPPLAQAAGVASLVKDINLTGVSSPLDFTLVGSTLFFTADDGVHGRELWKTDGTPAGTSMVADIASGAPAAFPQGQGYLTSFNGKLVFGADDRLHGHEAWISDGTPAGTKMLKDINPDGGASLARDFVAVGDILFFVAEESVHGSELWKTDGTEAGTALLKDITLNDTGYMHQPNGLININGTLFFSGDDGNTGGQLWKSDGTEAGTVLVKKIHPYASASVGQFTLVNNTIFFSAGDPVHGQELWKTDGTEAGTVLVKDIDPTGVGVDPYSSWPRGLIAYHGLLYFFAETIGSQGDLWKSDGTPEGTVLVQDLSGSTNSYAGGMVEINDRLLFTIQKGDSAREVWTSDGMPAGTSAAEGFNLIPTGSSFEYTPLLNSLYMNLDDGVRGSEFWMSDGTAAGTTLVRDIAPGAAGSNPRGFTLVNGFVVFAADDGAHGRELWRVAVTTSKVYLPLVQR